MKFRGILLDEAGNPIREATIHPYRLNEAHNCKSVGGGAPTPPGSFEVPGGIPAGWTLMQVVLPNGRKALAPDGILLNDDEPLTLQVVGSTLVIRRQGDPPAPARHRVVVTFGDSDTSDRGPIGARKTTVARELASDSIRAINRAQGNLPIGTRTEPDGGGAKRSGLEVVLQACTEIGVIDVAVCRFGLNDAHYYLSPPTPAGTVKFHAAYSAAIDALHAKGATVVLVTIVEEGGKRDRNADIAINNVLRTLAREKSCLLVDPGFDAEDDPDGYVWSDGIHLNDKGTKRVAELVRQAIGA